jgi:hypothetical protein
MNRIDFERVPILKKENRYCACWSRIPRNVAHDSSILITVKRGRHAGASILLCRECVESELEKTLAES